VDEDIKVNGAITNASQPLKSAERKESVKGKILRIEKKPSKYSSTLPFFYFFFKNESGRSYRSCISPIYRNYIRWNNIVSNAIPGETWLDGLIIKTVKGEEIVDADSFPRIILPIKAPDLINKKPLVIQQPLFGDYGKAHEKLKEIREKGGV
jgi:hypothetical protein